MLPKCEGREDLKIVRLHPSTAFYFLLPQLDFLVGFYQANPYPLTLHIMMESISSLLSIRDTCQYGIKQLKNLVLGSVTFGSEDYLASLGMYGPKRQCIDCIY